MRKLSLLILLILIIVPKNIKAEELYYIPWRNTYYMRSQHSYAFTKNNIQYKAYIPAIYTIITDKEDVDNKNAWSFHEKYTVPWQITDSNYFLAYCADLFVDIKEGEAYQKVDLKNSSFILDDAKEYIKGILQQSYPFISEEEMKTILKDKQVLVEKKVGDETFLTAPKNENPTRSVTLDELVSAIQTAIIFHTNPDSLDSIYSNTHELSSKTVLKNANLWKLTDKKGKYDEVENNITAIYNYLITQKQDLDDEKINRIGANNKQEILIGLKNVNNVDNVNVEIYEDDNLIQKTALKDQKEDYFNNYIVPLNKKVDIEKTSLKIDGTVYRADVFAYESVTSKTTAQTLVGLNNDNKALNLAYADKIIETNEKSVSVEKDANKKYLYPGEEFEYTFKVKNNENNDLTQILITDEVPDELSIVSASDGNISDNKIEFVVDLKPLEEKTFKATVKVKDNVKNGKISNKTSILLNNVKTNSNEITIEVIDNPQTGKNLYLPLSLVTMLILVIGTILIKKRKLYHL